MLVMVKVAISVAKIHSRDSYYLTFPLYFCLHLKFEPKTKYREFWQLWYDFHIKNVLIYEISIDGIKKTDFLMN